MSIKVWVVLHDYGGYDGQDITVWYSRDRAANYMADLAAEELSTIADSQVLTQALTEIGDLENEGLVILAEGNTINLSEHTVQGGGC